MWKKQVHNILNAKSVFSQPNTFTCALNLQKSLIKTRTLAIVCLLLFLLNKFVETMNKIVFQSVQRYLCVLNVTYTWYFSLLKKNYMWYSKTNFTAATGTRDYLYNSWSSNRWKCNYYFKTRILILFHSNSINLLLIAT